VTLRAAREARIRAVLLDLMACEVCRISSAVFRRGTAGCGQSSHLRDRLHELAGCLLQPRSLGQVLCLLAQLSLVQAEQIGITTLERMHQQEDM
jgi:hypothetical protein